MKDLDIIKQIEKELKVKLKKLAAARGRKIRWDQSYILNQSGQVTGLYLDGCKTKNLNRIISPLKDLKKLMELNLSSNQLSDISPLKDLKNLTELNLSFNEISDIIPINHLINLTRLFLTENPLSDFSSLKNLNNLKELYIGSIISYSENSITTIIDIKNKLSDISTLKDLKNLEILDLSFNQISDISPLEYLKNLKKLFLNSNQIKDIVALKNLNKLSKLFLQDNPIEELPLWITDYDMGVLWEEPNFGDLLRGYQGDTQNISFFDNPLKSPPIEIVKKGKTAVIEYFKSLEGERNALNEVKVLLVGDGGAGKTSLVKRVRGDKFSKNESQTHGINIRDWKVNQSGEDIIVHFWDFGGQEIMHATHQFFLSKRSLYILVLDGRKEEDAEYWLKHIESFGGDSPVLVVLNKMDENPGFDVNRKFLFDKYKGIKGFYRVSCAKGTGVKEFSAGMIGALTSVEILETMWARSWFSVKTQLEKMNDDFISYGEYIRICKKESITDKSTQNILVDFLNDLGVVLHFNDFKLLDTHVLNPKWVTQAVYKIINSEDLAKCNGILRLSLLDKILKKKKKEDYHYPCEKYRYIVELMMKFELCYEINNKTVLLPDLLEVQEPDFDFDYSNSLDFLIEYDFLPKSIIPRFIVKMHKDIKGDLRWRTGVVLEDKSFQSTALIKVDERDKKIYLYVNGEQKRDYFSVIRYAFLTINNSFEKLKSIEKVPMSDDSSITVSYEHLVRLEKMGVEKYIPDGSEKEYKVKDLLGTIYVENKTEKEILQILKKLKDQSDSQETLLKKANDIIQLQPNFFGLGVNLNALIKKLFNHK